MWPFDHNNHQVYQQYAQAYDTGNYNGFDPFQALGHVGQFMQSAPPDMQHRIYQQHFEQMPYEQRAALAQQMPPEYYADPNDSYSLAQNFLRMGQEKPHLLQGVFNHPLLLGAAVGLAGLVAKHMLAHHQQQQQQNGSGNQQFGGYNQGFQNQGYQQAPSYQQNQSQQNPYQQEQALQQEVNQLRREEQELREELREEERPRHHHHHQNQGY